MKPTFLIIGAAKCATSSVHRLLALHPNVCMSVHKEPRFFSDKAPWARGWEWYEGLFKATPETIAAGESSTDYGLPSRYTHLVDRIADLLPRVRLIYMVRHPIDRIESGWHMQNKNFEPPDFSSIYTPDAQYAVQMSDYWLQHGLYRRRFDECDILVNYYEDFVRDSCETLRRCMTHIGVDPAAYPWDEAKILVEHGANRKRLPRQYYGSLKRIANNPLIQSARRYVPSAAQEMVRTLITREYQNKTEWPNGLREQITDHLRDHTHRFLAWSGKPDDFWVL